MPPTRKPVRLTRRARRLLGWLGSIAAVVGLLVLLGLPSLIIDVTMSDNAKYGTVDVPTEPYTSGSVELKSDSNIRLSPHVITDDRGNACGKLEEKLTVTPIRITTERDINGPWLAFPIAQLPAAMQEACRVRKDSPNEVWVSEQNVVAQ